MDNRTALEILNGQLVILKATVLDKRTDKSMTTALCFQIGRTEGEIYRLEQLLNQ